ncbi:ORF21 protein [Purpureocillium lavendulum]|uniref:ORF21 protein n=1 Tax=Purpureocillium lavendulum TaxID=1247861 RepID=A0AB34FUB3_9HYPO|nr:ORF21 protein [Purpureocillium lavendulum]
MAATLLKRKRTSSDATLSFGALDASSAAAATAFNPFCHHPLAAVVDHDHDRDAHLNSRTWKRSRSNRPSDQEVHRKSAASWLPHSAPGMSSTCFPPERTLHLLLSAQQQQQHVEHKSAPTVHSPPAPSLPSSSASPAPERGAPLAGTFRQHHQPQPQPLPQQNQQRRQGSLHSFWAINSAPATEPDSMTGVQLQTQTSQACEDCGAALGAQAGAGGDGMDIDGASSDSAPCGACGKVVCFSCSVSSLGEEKRCLRCADRRVWVGGVGWTKVEVPAY